MEFDVRRTPYDGSDQIAAGIDSVNGHARLNRQVNAVVDVHLVAPFRLPIFVNVARDLGEGKNVLLAPNGVKHHSVAGEDAGRFAFTEMDVVLGPGFGTRLVGRTDHLQPGLAHGTTSQKKSRIT